MDAQPIRVRGILRGQAIVLDDAVNLPEGCPVSVEIVSAPASPEENARGWADMTPEEIASFEAWMTEFQGYPFTMPEAGPGWSVP